MDLKDILAKQEKVVVIVHFRLGADCYNGGAPPQNPAVHLQITVDPEKVSPSGGLIRLGETQGDEIMGWTRIDALEVVEILGRTDGTNVIPFGFSEAA